MNTQTETSSSYIRDIVVAHPFFKGINPHYLHLLTDSASFLRFGIGQEIFRERQDADHFYLVHQGQVALETFVPRLGSKTIQVIGAGEALGWSWLLPPFAWHFQARAIEPTEVIVLDGAHLLVAAERDNKFGYELMKRIAQVVIGRVQATRKQLLAREVESVLKG